MSNQQIKSQQLRTQPQKARDLHRISELLILGYGERELVDTLNQENDYALSLSNVKSDIGVLRREWSQYRHEEYNVHVGQELQKLRHAERDLWEQWNSSKSVGDEKVPADAVYMKLILDVSKVRMKLLGLEAPKTNITVINTKIENRNTIYQNYNNLSRLSDGELLELLKDDADDHKILEGQR